MSESVNKGIASNPIIHKFASSKGGKRRVPKGLAKLSPERRKEIAAMGGKKKYENLRNKG
jgi:hypothetical protein